MKENNFDIILGNYIEVYKPSYTGFQGWSNVREPHNYAHLDLITSGQITMTIDGKTHTFTKNQILAIPKNKAYIGKAFGNFSYYSFLFEYETNDKDTDFPFPVRFETNNSQYFIDKYRAAYNLNITKPYGYKVKIREIMYDVIAKICEEHYTNNYFNKTCYSIRKSVDYIEKNYANPDLTLNEIANQSGITDTHFRRLFKQFYGVTPITHITNLRLRKSKMLLSHTNLSVDEISKKCGFNEYSYFTRLFKKHFGMPPSNWREENKTI